MKKFLTDKIFYFENMLAVADGKIKMSAYTNKKSYKSQTGSTRIKPKTPISQRLG